MSIHPKYYLRATGSMEGEMIVVVKCRGDGEDCCYCSFRMRARAKMIVKEGLCTTDDEFSML